MSHAVRQEKVTTNGKLDGTIYTLFSGDSEAAVWPALGFNCFRWLIPTTRGTRVDVLWSDPDLFHNPIPTRSGNPILFPFPNRIRDGKYSWAGRSYEMPINDPQQRNAIHGFACYHAWRIMDVGADTSSSWITGVFENILDAATTVGLWPNEHRIEATYRLSGTRLRLECSVSHSGAGTFPFGIGFHPYFRVSADSAQVRAVLPEPASDRLQRWKLEALLPTGELLGLDRLLESRLRNGDSGAGQVWDDLFHISTRGDPAVDLHNPDKGWTLRIRAWPSFREYVLFTPPHRQSVCVEPYTCITDAISLQQRGVSAGLLTLEPGQNWTCVFEMTGR